jgi:outer membrane protein TolC
LLLATGYGASAQGGYEAILQQIEHNSTTLAALRERMEAEKRGNHTGLTPANPEVEVGYLWGSPSAVGNRTDVSASQTFDFPSAYVHRGRIANLRDMGVELAYSSARMDLLLEAKRTLIELTHLNLMFDVYRERFDRARAIADSYSERLARGDVNAIENNRAQLNAEMVAGELARVDIERNALYAELQRMNGGESIDELSATTNYPESSLPEDFEAWSAATVEANPAMQYRSTQVDIAQRQVKLDRSIAMPKIAVGYMSERVAGERFQGVTAGLSIPLWENRNRVKQAQAETRAAEAEMTDARGQYLVRLRTLYGRVMELNGHAQNLRDALGEYNNVALLDKALAAGEISLPEYLLDAEYYYATIDKVLEAERDYRLALAELCAVEL